MSPENASYFKIRMTLTVSKKIAEFYLLTTSVDRAKLIEFNAASIYAQYIPMKNAMGSFFSNLHVLCVELQEQKFVISITSF